MHELLHRAECNDASPENTDAVLLDGMALLQTLKDIPDTFGDLAEKVVRIIISTAKKKPKEIGLTLLVILTQRSA